ncbi:MAG: archaemetzincin [Acidobacteriota bacterium]
MAACFGNNEAPATNTAAPKTVFPEIHASMAKIEPFFERMGKPAAYDWLASHNEPGQTFDEYVDADPVKPTKERNKIYVLPLGSFTQRQKKVIDTTTGYLEMFYGLPIRRLPSQIFRRPLSVKNSRRNPSTGSEQIRTGYILDDILKRTIPNDAAALIAFTSDDLYPDASMNYVFGQSSLADRVGVWSLSRLDANANYDTFLRRTIKIATHETGHMFSMRHCIKYECVMSGANYLGETDRRPVDACPECSAKVWWLTGAVPSERYQKLADFCRRNGLAKEADEFSRKAAAVKSP